MEELYRMPVTFSQALSVKQALYWLVYALSTNKSRYNAVEAVSTLPITLSAMGFAGN